MSITLRSPTTDSPYKSDGEIENSKKITLRSPNASSPYKSVPEKEEGAIETGFRYAAQPLKALAMRAAGLPGFAAEVLATPSFDEEELEILEKRFPNRNIRKELEDASARARSGVPVLSNIGGWLEQIGIPTEAHTEGQKALEVGSLVFGGKIPAAMKIGKSGIAISLYEGLRHKGLSHEAAMAAATLGTEAGASLLHVEPLPFPTTKYQGRQYQQRPGGPSPGGPGGPSPGGPDSGLTPPPILAAQEMLPGQTTEVGQAGKFQLRPGGIPETEASKIVHQQEPSYDVFSEAGKHLIPQESVAIAPQPEAPPALTSSQQTATKIHSSELTRPTELAQEGGKPIKATIGGKDVGYRPVDDARDLPSRINNVVSKNKFDSPTEGGIAYKQQINKNADIVNKKVNDAYRESEALMKTESGIVEKTANDVQEIIDDLVEMGPGKLSPQQAKLLDYAREMQKKIGFKDGFIEVTPQSLIEDIQNINKLVGTFERGSANNIFYPLKRTLEEGVDTLIAGNKPAISAWAKAKGLSKEYHHLFDNEHVAKFLDPLNENYEDLFNVPSKVDAFVPFQRAMRIVGSSEGKNMSQIAKASLVKQTMQKYLDNPKLVRTAKFREDLSRLRQQVTPEEARQIEEIFLKESATTQYRKGKVTKGEWIDVPVEAEGQVEIPARYKGYTPEKLSKEAETVTGIRTLRHELSKVPGGKELYERVAKQKAMNSLYGGEAPTDEALFKALGNSEKTRYLEEVLGKDKVGILKKYKQDVLEQKARSAKYAERKEKYAAAIKKYDARIAELEKMASKESFAAELASAKKNRLAIVAKKQLMREALSPIPAPDFLKQMAIDYFID